MSSRKRKKVGVASTTRNRSSATPRAQLMQVRSELRLAIGKLKALECADSTVLVEFWHALDWVNGKW